MKKNWFELEDPMAVDTPALIVYPERVKQNIDLLNTMIDDPRRIRPHVKTHKTREATCLLLAAGIQKFKCATIAEAAMLGNCQAPDVLLAYPLFGPKLGRFIQLIRDFPGTRYAAIVDNSNSARRLSDAAIAQSLMIDTYIDLNIGMDRTGIHPGREAIRLYQEIQQLGGISFRGFHAYDGHVHETDLTKRTQLCHDNFEPIKRMLETLEQKGYKKSGIVIGGSPSFPVYAKYSELECSPGTFIFWDKGYQEQLPEQAFLPAAVVMTRVVSIPATNKLCLDLGHKAIAPENPLERRVHFLNAPELIPISHSEEHLVVAAPGDRTWQVGDVLYGLPYHICPTVNLYDEMQAVENGVVVGKWKVAGRKR